MADHLCMLRCFSKYLEMPEDALISLLGHDGSEPVFCRNMQLVESGLHKHVNICKRGFHIQEFYPVLFSQRIFPVEIDMHPGTFGENETIYEYDNREFLTLMVAQSQEGIFLGQGKNTNHCWYRKGDAVFDPENDDIVLGLEAFLNSVTIYSYVMFFKVITPNDTDSPAAE